MSGSLASPLINGYINARISDKLYFIDTVADMIATSKLKHGDCVKTLGYYAVNDGGSAIYEITSGLTADIDIVALSNGLQARIIIDTPDIDVRKFGVKADGNYFAIDGVTGKYTYYSDSAKTVLATDNSSLIQNIINEYGGKNDLIFIGSICMNSAVQMVMGIQLKGTSSLFNLLGTNFVTNNDTLNYYFYFIMTESDVPAQWHFSSIRNIHFNGGYNASNGILIKGFGESSVIRECYFDKFNNAGIQIYGTSTSTPVEICSFGNCKYGIEIFQIDGTNATGSYFLDKISGDTNDALIYVHDERTVPSSSLGLGMYFEITGVKSESNNHVLLVDKMSYKSSFKISGRIEGLRDSKWTSASGTPYGVTIRNATTPPSFDIDFWAVATVVILNDEINSRQISADANLIYQKITYGVRKDIFMGNDGKYFELKNMVGVTNSVDTTVLLPQITLFNTSTSGTFYMTNGGLNILDWTGGLTEKSIFPASHIQTLTTIKRIDTNVAQTTYFNSGGKEIEKNGVIYDADDNYRIPIACGESVNIIYLTSSNRYHVM